MNGHVHVTGVAGAGMSAVAQVLSWTHGRVTGSDRYYDQGLTLPVLTALQAAGVELVPQDGAAIDGRTEAVVYSTAIEETNPDFAAAKRHGVPLCHRADMLARLARGQTVLAVAGTAGKTTTAGMLGWILEQLGTDPTVINGGAVVDWADARRVGNVRQGAEEAPWVIEVDESDRSLLAFHPEWSILTNISQDHFSLAEVENLFRAYASQVRTGVVCGTGVKEVLGPLTARIVEAAGTVRPEEEGFMAEWRGVVLPVRLPGAHNALNALLAAEQCACLGHAPDRIAEAVSRFRGIQRRLERVDPGGPVRVIDDYSHNPAKLAAAWKAVAAPGRRVLGAWRPHGYGPLRAMMEPLADALASVCRAEDRLWLLPVYDAGGSADRSVNANELVKRLRARGAAVNLAGDYTTLGDAMMQEVRARDTLLIMGARDPHLPVFAREMALRTAGLSGSSGFPDASRPPEEAS